MSCGLHLASNRKSRRLSHSQRRREERIQRGLPPFEHPLGLWDAKTIDGSHVSSPP